VQSRAISIILSSRHSSSNALRAIRDKQQPTQHRRKRQNKKKQEKNRYLQKTGAILSLRSTPPVLTT